MSVENSTNYPFSSYEERTLTAPPSGVTAGSGGSDMDLWTSYDRELQYETVFTHDFTNNSAYSLPGGLGDSTLRPFSAGWPVGERDISTEPDSTVITGAGGDTMDLWTSYGPNLMLETVATHDFTNKAATSLPKGLIDGRLRQFSSDYEAGWRSLNATPTDAESGSGGDVMDLYGYNRELQLETVAHHDFTNRSAYTLYQGVMDGTTNPFSASWANNERRELETRPGDGALAGAGGDDMSLWGLQREDILRRVTQHTYSNESSYLLPGGVVDATSNKFSTSFETGERIMGDGVEVTAQGPENGPMTGVLSFLEGADDTVVAQTELTGSALLAPPPTTAIIEGSNADSSSPSRDLLFEPEGDPLPDRRNDIEAGASYLFKYEALGGKVTDAQGYAVSAARVSSDLGTVETDSYGKFEFVAPDGMGLTIEALDRTVSKNVTIGSDDNITFQYAGIEVKITDPNTGDPIEGAPVEIGRDQYWTDEYGEVREYELGIISYELLVMDYFTRTVDLTEQGQIVLEEFGDGSSSDEEIGGAAIRVMDGESGRPVQNATAYIPDLGIRSETNSLGRVAVLTDESGDATELEVFVARDDKRYYPARFVIDTTGSTTEFEANLQPKAQTVNM